MSFADYIQAGLDTTPYLNLAALGNFTYDKLTDQWGHDQWGQINGVRLD